MDEHTDTSPYPGSRRIEGPIAGGGASFPVSLHGAASVVGALLCIGAGIYLLGADSGSISINGQTGQSWLEVIAHGMGVYFIGKGILLGPATWNGGETKRVLSEIRDAVTRG